MFDGGDSVPYDESFGVVDKNPNHMDTEVDTENTGYSISSVSPSAPCGSSF
jgi:hypothetical protein